MRLNKYEKQQVKNAVVLVVLSIIAVFLLTYYSGKQVSFDSYNPGLLTDCTGNTSCFAERSAKCMLTEVRTVLKSGDNETVLFNEIQGKNDSGLGVVFFRVVSTTVPSLQGREMTCGLTVEQAAGTMPIDYRKDCSGSFVEVVAPPV